MSEPVPESVSRRFPVEGHVGTTVPHGIHAGQDVEGRRTSWLVEPGPVLLSAGVPQDALSIVLLAYGIAGIGGLVLAGTLADRFPVGLLRATVSVTAVALVGALLVGLALPLTLLGRRDRAEGPAPRP